MVWSDNETKIDLLNYLGIAKAIIELAKEPRLDPVTIGIHGGWGAGKSSILKMVEESLDPMKKTDKEPDDKDKKKIACIWFNGWLYQGFDDAKTALMEVIVDEITKLQPWNVKLQGTAKSLLRRVNWLKVGRTAAGLAWTASTGLPDPHLFQTSIEGVKKFFEAAQGKIDPEALKKELEPLESALDKEADSPTKEITEFRKEFEELLKEAKIDKLVVLVDDLDRCLPKTSIATLEAIRLFLMVDHTVFIVAADEEMIEYAVRDHFPNLPVSVRPHEFSRSYLEKIIQIPFRLPQLNQPQASAYIALLLCDFALHGQNNFAKLLDEAKKQVLQKPWNPPAIDEALVTKALGNCPAELHDPLLVAKRIAPLLSKGVKGNPRQIKRFLNTLMIRMRIAKAYGLEKNISQPVLAKIMLLERFEPAVYTKIEQLVSESADGKCEQLILLEKTVKAAESNGSSTKKKNQEKIDPVVEEWLKTATVSEWALLAPELNLDLTPYFFICRQKAPVYVGYAVLDEATEELARQMLTAKRINIVAMKQKIQALSATSAGEIFDRLRSKVSESEDWSARPDGMDGLLELCKVHPELQGRLIEFFDSVDPEMLGGWPPVALAECLTEQTSIEAYGRLQAKWANSGNAQLKKAIETSKQLGK